MIKLLNIINQTIKEAKQVGIIYHFTSFNNMVSIAKDNFQLKEGIISFTRNKNMPLFTDNDISTEIRIVINGDKLSERYRIKSYADIEGGYGRQGEGGDESEETIDSERYGGIVDISKCIIKIDILETRNKNLKVLTQLLEEKNIPYTI